MHCQTYVMKFFMFLPLLSLQSISFSTSLLSLLQKIIELYTIDFNFWVQFSKVKTTRK